MEEGKTRGQGEWWGGEGAGDALQQAGVLPVPCGLAGEMVKEMSLKLLLVRLLEASLKPRLFLPAGG